MSEEIHVKHSTIVITFSLYIAEAKVIAHTCMQFRLPSNKIWLKTSTHHPSMPGPHSLQPPPPPPPPLMPKLTNTAVSPLPTRSLPYMVMVSPPAPVPMPELSVEMTGVWATSYVYPDGRLATNPLELAQVTFTVTSQVAAVLGGVTHVTREGVASTMSHSYCPMKTRVTQVVPDEEGENPVPFRVTSVPPAMLPAPGCTEARVRGYSRAMPRVSTIPSGVILTERGLLPALSSPSVHRIES